MTLWIACRWAVLAIVAAGSGWMGRGLYAGVTLVDDFNRGTGSIVGADWQKVIAPANNDVSWSLDQNTLKMVPTTVSGKSFLLNTATAVADSYTVRTDFRFSEYSGSANNWFGIVFNYQDTKNYWSLRVKASSSTSQFVQVVYCNNNSESYDTLTGDRAKAVTLTNDVTYTAVITVNGSSYAWQILQGATEIYSGTATANTGAPTFTGGTVGYYFNGLMTSTGNTSFVYDNFSTTAGVPEPAALGLMLPAATLLFAARGKKMHTPGGTGR